MYKQQTLFSEISTKAPVVPVLVVEKEAHAAPLAMALYEGGAVAVEVTLRTQAALLCIEEMKKACPELLVGAGTVMTESDIDACLKAGVDFIVTPGMTPTLTEALLKCPVPVCPGMNTPGEAMRLYEMGFDHQNFFPAGASGGILFLKALSGPMQSISFMPTGGVTSENMADYLDLPNVFAVGGSWIAPLRLLDEGRFEDISSRMKDALIIAGATAVR